MGHFGKRTRRLALSAAAGLLVLLATGAYFLASSGTVLVAVTVHERPGVTRQGTLASYAPFPTTPLVYDPFRAVGRESFSKDGYALGQVTTAAGHIPYIDFAWTNPETVVRSATTHKYAFNPLAVCTSTHCDGWIDFGIYVPIYQGWCRTPAFNPYSTSKGWQFHDVVTIVDPALEYDHSHKTFRTGKTVTGTSDGIFCAELDRGAVGSESTTGVVPISAHLFSSTLHPRRLTTGTATTAFVPPTFASTASSNQCLDATPSSGTTSGWGLWRKTTTSSASRWQWCTPSRATLDTATALHADQNIFFVVATPASTSNWTPRNWPHSDLLHTLKFFVTVH